MAFPYNKKILVRSINVATTAAAFGLIATQAHGLSLDDAIAEQLGSPTGSVPCGVLLGNGASLSGELETYCARAIPAGASTSSNGGGSITSTSVPGADGTLGQTARQDSEYDIAKNWSWFLSADNEQLEKTETESEGAFEADLQRVLMGVTYAPSAKVNYSLAIDKTTQEGDFVDGGQFENDSLGIRLLAIVQPSEKLSLLFSGVYEDASSERTRISSVNDTFNGVDINFLNGTPTSNYDYNQYGFNTQLNYELVSGQFTFTPLLGLDYLNTDYGTYSETGSSGLELTFHNDSKDSTQATFGFNSSYAVGTNFGVFIPQLGAVWRHEFSTDARDVNVSFVQDLNSTQFTYQTDELDSDFIDLNLGAVLVFKNGIQSFVNVQTLVEHDYYDSTIANLGIRVEL